MQTFCRHFLWHSLMLWPEDMPERTIIFLSGNDALVPAHLVVRHLEAATKSAAIRYYPNSRHGAYLLDKNYQACVVGILRVFFRADEDNLLQPFFSHLVGFSNFVLTNLEAFIEAIAV